MADIFSKTQFLDLFGLMWPIKEEEDKLGVVISLNSDFFPLKKVCSHIYLGKKCIFRSIRTFLVLIALSLPVRVYLQSKEYFIFRSIKRILDFSFRCICIYFKSFVISPPVSSLRERRGNFFFFVFFLVTSYEEIGGPK